MYGTGCGSRIQVMPAERPSRRRTHRPAIGVGVVVALRRPHLGAEEGRPRVFSCDGCQGEDVLFWAVWLTARCAGGRTRVHSVLPPTFTGGRGAPQPPGWDRRTQTHSTTPALGDEEDPREVAGWGVTALMSVHSALLPAYRALRPATVQRRLRRRRRQGRDRRPPRRRRLGLCARRCPGSRRPTAE